MKTRIEDLPDLSLTESISDCPKSEGGRHVFVHYADTKMIAIYACQYCSLEIEVPFPQFYSLFRAGKI